MHYPNRAPRYPTHIPVIVTGSGQSQSAYIVDINAYGACVAGVSAVEEDQTVHLRGAVETNLANVRWTENNRCGVFFDQPIPPQYLAMMRLRGLAYQPPLDAIEHRAT